MVRLRAKRSRRGLMFRRSFSSSVALLAGLFVFSDSVNANVIANVGSGADTVQVYFNWPDAFNAHYYASYGSGPTDSIDGYDATQIAVNSDPNLTTVWSNFGTAGAPNYFLSDAGYTGGHTSVGLSYSASTPENYWHEWVNYGGGWVFGNGASIDSLTSGDSIGWVFGSNSTPVPEPVGVGAFVLGSGLLLRRKR